MLGLLGVVLLPLVEIVTRSLSPFSISSPVAALPIRTTRSLSQLHPRINKYCVSELGRSDLALLIVLQP